MTAALYGSGELSGGQVAAVMANVSDATEPILAAQEPEVVPWLAPLTVAGVARPRPTRGGALTFGPG